jgi:endonuclease/exonuclease/phosphatase family metal-dependent hydrolase
MSYGQQINLMTYNLRYDNPGDGENSWPERKEVLLSQILFYQPDVLGTQEGLEHQLRYLEEHMGSYKYVGVARADVKENGKGEYSAVFYNVDKFKNLKSGTFWLSDTPEKASRGWDASLNRICTYILLQDKNSGKRFWVFNTHFDHKGAEARKKSAALIIKKIREINKEDLPVFLMGDFNLTPDQSPIKYIAGKLNDSKTVSKQLPFGPDETFNGFKVCENRDRRIDYIFVSPKNITVKKYGVLANVKKMKYPSDHYPVFISAEIK